MSVLGKSEIQRRLEHGEIFMPDSWDERCLRGASYDLRVAPDYLIAPDGTRFWPDDPSERKECSAAFRLLPGEVTFVSSVERLCMPFDLVGNIAQKFTIARSGLLVLSGLLVDPGYGLERQEDGSWRVREGGQRLHFQVANVGAEEFTVIPGKTSIAAIQILPVEGSVISTGESDAALRVPDSDDLLNDLFVQGDGRPLAPFAFFPRTAELGQSLARVRGKLDEQSIKLESTKRSTDQVVVFGVLGITVTLFTVACAALIDAIANGSTDAAIEAASNTDIATVINHEEAIIGVIVIGVLIIFALVATFGVYAARASARTRKKPSDS